MDMSTAKWYNKTISIEEGIEKAEDIKRNRHDIMTEFRNMEVAQNGDGNLCTVIGGKEYAPTKYAWRKLLSWHNLPINWVEFFSTDILNDKNPELSIKRDSVDFGIIRSAFHRHRKSVDHDKKFLFRTYSDGTLRTMASDKYGIIDNGWYLNTLKDLFKQLGGDEPRLFHWRGDEDTIYGNLLLMDTVVSKEDGDYGAMLSMSNCEIGKRVFSQRPSIFRGLCTNGMIFGQQKGVIVKKRHLGNIDYKLLTENLVDNIKTQIPIAQEGIDRFLKLTERKVEVPLKNLFAVLVDRYGLTSGTKSTIHKVIDSYVNHEKDGIGGGNLFGVINSFTRTGQVLDDEEWVRFDEIGGDLMNISEGQWTNLQARAKTLGVEELERVYGV